MTTEQNSIRAYQKADNETSWIHCDIESRTLHKNNRYVLDSNLWIILWHDVWKPEMRCQRSTTETSVARQRLAKHCSRSNELSWQRILRITQELWDTVFCLRSPLRRERTSNWFAGIYYRKAVEGDKKGSLESETVKYGREPHGTRTRKWLLWRGRRARPLVRESAPHQQTRNCLTVIKIWS
jgi:hypothetical protein